MDSPGWTPALVGVILAPHRRLVGGSGGPRPRLPVRVSRGLNVESGLKDGICVPLLVILLAATSATKVSPTQQRLSVSIFEQIGYGLLGGAVAATVGSMVMAWASPHGFMSLGVAPCGSTLATAAACYGLAVPPGGSGFIAAFIGGLVFGWLNQKEAPVPDRTGRRWGWVVRGVDVRPVRSGGGWPPTAPLRRCGGASTPPSA